MANSAVEQIESKINHWLDTHGNKLELDLTSTPIPFRHHSETLFTSEEQIQSTLGFKDANLSSNDSLDKFRSNFNFITLDRIPVPGLEGIPANWQIYPQTPMSSFSDGVTIESYDASTQILQIHIETNFFAIYGRLPQTRMMADARAPEGTYLQVRRDFQGDIRLRAKLVF